MTRDGPAGHHQEETTRHVRQDATTPAAPVGCAIPPPTTHPGSIVQLRERLSPGGNPAAQTWVHDHARSIPEGRVSIVAAAIRRKATRNHLDATKRKPADTAASYLLNKKPYLDYPTALARGWPIATGAIEGACRHLVQDRMDRTGARWGLAGAEAILKLRALRSNGDFDDYWAYHLAQEQQRVHAARYANSVIPAG
jgi:hypothetical protein